MANLLVDVVAGDFHNKMQEDVRRWILFERCGNMTVPRNTKKYLKGNSAIDSKIDSKQAKCETEIQQ